MYPVIDKNNIVISWHPSFYEATKSLKEGLKVGKIPQKIPPIKDGKYVTGMNLDTMQY